MKRSKYTVRQVLGKDDNHPMSWKNTRPIQKFYLIRGLFFLTVIVVIFVVSR